MPVFSSGDRRSQPPSYTVPLLRRLWPEKVVPDLLLPRYLMFLCSREVGAGFLSDRPRPDILVFLRIRLLGPGRNMSNLGVDFLGGKVPRFSITQRTGSIYPLCWSDLGLFLRGFVVISCCVTFRNTYRSGSPCASD